MGYIFIIITVILNVTKGLCSKKASLRLDGISDNINLNLLRNSICIIIGGAILALGTTGFSMPKIGWIISIISGVFFSFNYIVWIIALKTDAYMFGSAANNASFIISALCGIIFFGERLTVPKAIGALLVLVAMYFMTLYQKSFGGKPSKFDFLMLFLVFFTSGMNTSIQKWFTKALPDTSVQLYTFYTFAFSILFLIVYRLILKSPHSAKKQLSTIKSLLPITLVMAVGTYGATYFQARAAALLDAVVVYPLNNGLNLIGASLMAWAAFGEKPNRYSIIGAILVFTALVLSRL
jgi:drug/metabolite transporter (DMT)-like permease